MTLIGRARTQLGATRRRAQEVPFNAQALARRDGRRRLLGMGDSHIGVLRDVAALRPDLRVDVCSVQGASALGIANRQSATSALETFERRLARVRPWQALCFELGEVDCGWALWKRATRRAEPLSAQVERSVENYARFLAGVGERGLRDVTVLSVPLPTVEDYATRPGSVMAIRADVTASIEERTALTDDYNARLAALCADRGHRFVDVTADLRDERTGLVAERFRHPDPGDHHLHPQAYAAVLASRL
jgi:hypothetical protein